jgi:hypothetical protein
MPVPDLVLCGGALLALAAGLPACNGDDDPTGVTLTIASVQIISLGLSVDSFLIAT